MRRFFKGVAKGKNRMEVRCDKCQARYKVADEKIGPQGLTMKCGKCANTFRVSRDPNAPAAKPQPDPSAAAKPAPKAPATPGAAPAAPRPPAAKPGAVASKPASAAPAPADEGAGRTMMFQTGSLPPKAPAAPAKPAPKAPPPGGESGATMVFGQSPVVPASKPAMPSRPAPAKPAAEGESGATMVFGQSPVAAVAKPAVPARPPVAAAPAPSAASSDDSAGSTMMFGSAPILPTTPSQPKVPKAPEPVRETEPELESAAPPALAPVQPEPTSEASTDESAAAGDAPEPETADEQAAAEHPAEEPAQDHTSEQPSADGGVHVDGMEAEDTESTTADGAGEGTFDKAPPRGLLIGVAAGLAGLLVVAGGLVAYKKMGHRPVNPAALEALAAAQAAADKDSLASIADAEAKAKDAVDQAGPKARFPQGTATLAQIEVQWADALTDQAAMLSAKAQAETDEAKKSAAEAKVTELQEQAKAKLKAAFDAVAPAVKADPRSPDLEIALAEYYRAQKSSANMNKELKKAQALKADEARIALVQGEGFAQDPDDAEKALPRLKAAQAAAPQSARIHFRTAVALLAAHNSDEALKELKETLRLSPQHERAKMAMEQLATTDGK